MDTLAARAYRRPHERHAGCPLPGPDHTAAYLDADPARGVVGAGDEHLSALAAGHGRLFRDGVPPDPAVRGALSGRQCRSPGADGADLRPVGTPSGDPVGDRYLPG